jgi:HEAT repeat protein
MKKVKSRLQPLGSKSVKPQGRRPGRARCVLAVALGAAALFAPNEPQAQRSGEKAVNVKDVSTNRQGSQTTVSISGEGSMNRVQTWQDEKGFHVVFPGGKGAPSRLPAGVKAERVGDSLELIVPTKEGANVRVQPRADRLDLVLDGGLDEVQAAAQGAGEAMSAAQASPQERRGGGEGRRAQESAGRRDSAGGDSAAPQKGEPAAQGGTAPRANAAGPAPAANEANGPAAGDPNFNSSVAFQTPEVGQPAAGAASAQASVDAGGEGFSFFSLTGLLALASVAGLVGIMFVVRRNRAGSEDEAPKRASKKESPKKAVVAEKAVAEEPKPLESFELPPFEPYTGDRRKRSVPVAQDRRRGTEEAGQRFSLANGALTPEVVADKLERKAESRPVQASVPAVLFGAYRIDQEIGKLVMGQPHSIEVLASRATDDRRAIETSLVKALNSTETGENGVRRVRQALEDYGFVARQSATLLLSSDTYDRVSAARSLGQIRSESSLPFLLEALYDVEPLVRTEAVASLGSLGLPRAIGALIDMARRYPEAPATLLAPALTSCSFEAQEWGWISPAEGVIVGGFESRPEEGRDGDLAGFDAPTQVSQLPEWLEDENLADALERLESADVEARISAAQSLAQYQVRRAVAALTAILVRDESSAVRAAAVTSLGAIDHESVFAPVLFALADDSREVRAAAARAYAGFNFERAEAAAHLVETADRETLEDLARACVKSGVAAQSLGRLASEDRRQAYESYSILLLVVRGGETAPIIEAVASHRDTNVRLAAVRLASLIGDARLLEGLRELAGRDGLPQVVGAAIADVVGQGSRVNG